MSEGGQAVQHCQWLANLGYNAGVLDRTCIQDSVAMGARTKAGSFFHPLRRWYCDFFSWLVCVHVSSGWQKIICGLSNDDVGHKAYTVTMPQPMSS